MDIKHNSMEAKMSYDMELWSLRGWVYETAECRWTMDMHPWLLG